MKLLEMHTPVGAIDAIIKLIRRHNPAILSNTVAQEILLWASHQKSFTSPQGPGYDVNQHQSGQEALVAALGELKDSRRLMTAMPLRKDDESNLCCPSQEEVEDVPSAYAVHPATKFKGLTHPDFDWPAVVITLRNNGHIPAFIAGLKPPVKNIFEGLAYGFGAKATFEWVTAKIGSGFI